MVVEEMEQEPIPQTIKEYVPSENALDVTSEKNGGVLKDILKEGVGTDFPMTGDKVFVHYVGTLLDGTKFDSSRDRGDYFEFNLGKGSVIKAWDLGVATMKRGELAVLYCKSEYAYGESGSPPKIPANATLIFEVELFDWKGEDVSESKDEGVLKSIIVSGEGYLTPKEGATCDVEICGSFNGVEFDKRSLKFTIGEASEANLIEGVEIGVKHMKKGEIVKLKIKSYYAFGVDGSSTFNIPPSADIEYQVKLVQFEKSKESWELDEKEKLEQSEICKSKGTDYFKNGKYKIATKYYKRIIDYLKNEDSFSPEDTPKRIALLLAAHLNEAMCRLKMKEDIEAITSCDEALKLDPKNEKGLFRRGSAHLSLQDFNEAIVDFKAVLELDPENKAAKNQIAIASHKIKQQLEKEKKTYAGMFTKFAQADSKKHKDVPLEDGESKKDDEKDETCCNNGEHDHFGEGDLGAEEVKVQS